MIYSYNEYKYALGMQNSWCKFSKNAYYLFDNIVENVFIKYAEYFNHPQNNMINITQNNIIDATDHILIMNDATYALEYADNILDKYEDYKDNGKLDSVKELLFFDVKKTKKNLIRYMNKENINISEYAILYLTAVIEHILMTMFDIVFDYCKNNINKKVIKPEYIYNSFQKFDDYIVYLPSLQDNTV